MPRKCGCTTQKCFCAFEDTDSVSWSGSGTIDDPYVPNASLGLEVLDTSTLDLTLTPTEDGILLSAQPFGNVHVNVFTASGTWNKPAGINAMRVVIIGGGGGGAGGGYLNSGSAQVWGGGGGAGGSVTTVTYMGGSIPASAAVVVGFGGAGGAAISSGMSLIGGNAGAVGGVSSFDIYKAGGGGGGLAGPGGGGGQTDPMATAGLYGTAPGQPGANPITQNEAGGYNVYVADGRGFEGWPYLAPAGGGSGLSLIPSGGGYATPGAYSLPGKGKRDAPVAGLAENGLDELVTRMGGSGGGGTFSQAGGNGGKYGGGGGGGGYGLASHPSGKGGNGGPGLVVVMSW